MTATGVCVTIDLSIKEKGRAIMRRSLSMLILSVVLAFMAVSTCFAGTENVNVSTTKPGGGQEDGISSYTVDKPVEAYDLSSRAYHFAGEAESSTLYTNYYFTNVSQLTISVHNTSDTNLYIEVRKIIWTGVLDEKVERTVVYPGCSLYTVVTGLKSNEKYFLQFSAPSHFYGELW